MTNEKKEESTKSVMSESTMTNTTAATTTAMSSLLLEVSPPPEPKHSRILEKFMFMSVFNVLGLPMIIYLYLSKRPIVSHIFGLARQSPISISSKDDALINKALSLPSAQVYLKSKALEYQLQEGYCSVATERCVCKSIPSFPTDQIPNWTRGGPSTAPKFADAMQKEQHLQSTVVYGSQGYDEFVEALQKLNTAPNQYRIAVNFLRSSLFGFTSPKFLPSSWLLSLLAGHFSPVLGYMPDHNLVAVFDVNYKYGFYLCDTKRLFDACNTMDVMTGTTRGLIVTEISKK